MAQKQKTNKFYEVIRPVLIACRISGSLPIEGLDKNSEELKFSWKSLYVLAFTIPISIVNLISLCIFFYSCLSKDTKFMKHPEMAFLLYGASASVVYLNFGINFRKMINKIESVEGLLPSVANHGELMRKTRFILSIFIVGSVADYLFQTTVIALYIRDCFLLPDDSGLYLKSLFMRAHSCIFNKIPFDYSIGFILQLSKIQTAFSSTMGEVLIITCSLYLENRLKHFNKYVFEKQMKTSADRVNWNEIQYHYTNLSNLVSAVDRHLCPIIFVTFFTNVLVICQRIFLFMGDLTTRKLSFYWSILVIVTKTIAMIFSASRVHPAGRKPLLYIGIMPNNLYTYEAQRFMDQVYHSRVALSGLGLFHFTRDTFLTVCSVLITYELMLFQM